jgi:hypothetical protein
LGLNLSKREVSEGFEKRGYLGPRFSLYIRLLPDFERGAGGHFLDGNESFRKELLIQPKYPSLLKGAI